MIRISGPSKVSIFQSTDSLIILFGDTHNSKSKSCYRCKKDKHCYDIVSFIEKVKCNVDIFIESPWKEAQHVIANIKELKDDYLSELWHTYYDKIYNHQEIRNGKRYHFTDIRYEKHILFLNYTLDALDERIKSQMDFYVVAKTLYDFPKFNTLVLFVDALIYSNDISKSLKKLFGEENAKWYTFMDVIKRVKKGKKDIYVHRIRKQIMKLSKNDREILLRYHEDVIRDFKKWYPTVYKQQRAMFIKDKQLQNKTLSNIYLEVTSHLMDMYHLARMLYYKNKNDIIVSYTGEAHTKNYETFFKYYYKMDEILVDQGRETKNSRQRCVSIPQKIVKDLLV